MIRPQKGFTLVEMLAALFIFSLLSTAALFGLRILLQTEAHQETIVKETEALQWTYLYLQQDLQHFQSRIQDPYTLITFTRETSPQSSRRVAYHVANQQLIRTLWDDEGKKNQRVMLNNVQQITVRYLDMHQQWLSVWPTDAPAPRAIEWVLETQALGTITWIMVLSNDQTS